MASDVVAAALAQHKRMATLAAHTPSPSSPPPADGEPQSPRQDSGTSSKLQYDKPELYVLMMHDGDGQPDDMPVPGDTTMGDLNELEAVVVPKGEGWIQDMFLPRFAVLILSIAMQFLLTFSHLFNIYNRPINVAWQAP